MDAPPPPPPYPKPQQEPEKLIIRETQYYEGESNRTSDKTHNQPLSSKPSKDALLQTLSLGSPPQLSRSAAESKSSSYHMMSEYDENFARQHLGKSKYVKKEQQIRAQQLERDKEKYLWSSAYMARRVNSASSINSLPSGDFQNSDWTPQDSAYGAAFPFCGWIPKGLREAVEKFLVAVALALLIYIIVTLGMKLTEGITGRKPSSDATVYTDDDFYVEEKNYYEEDDDDLFSNDDYRI